MCAIVRFGGRDIDPYSFHPEDFQRYLDRVGVRFFTARELVAPHNQKVAADMGLTYLMPPQKWWPRGAAICLIGDIFRKKIDYPVYLRNWYRPTCPNYNAAVGGVENSAHITASAIDFDFRTKNHRRIAETVVRRLWTSDPWLKIGLGLGAKTIHLDILQRRRIWEYPSYSK